jgi:hypothetical protein
MTTEYRFPDGDFAIAAGGSDPEVGSTISARGELWTVAEVTSGTRTVVRLEHAEIEPSSD